MSTQRVPLEALQKIRQHLKSGLVVPESENNPNLYADVEEPPTPESLDGLSSLFHFGGSLEEAIQMPNNQGQWFISATNPGDVIMKLPGVKLKPHFRLVSYLFRMDNDGTSATWALPESFSTTAHLEKALLIAGGRDTPPKPEAALTDFMAAIEGDNSPMSFIIASLLRREILEMGKMGRVAGWTHHCLINTLPAARWQWRIETPKDFSPKVRVFLDGRVAIEFFTCRTVAPIALFQHVDQYPAGHYHAKHLDRAIAIAQAPSQNGKKPA
ncbi:MAG: hypothetical protein MUC48_16255 [Leptolyngbya sp. Prado105]|jgi:hypothetical protein|nr:hypothetical protein [Leptolyngbya sp. Prado105]